MDKTRCKKGMINDVKLASKAVVYSHGVIEAGEQGPSCSEKCARKTMIFMNAFRTYSSTPNMSVLHH